MFIHAGLFSQNQIGDTCKCDIHIENKVLKKITLRKWNTINIDSCSYIKIFLYDCKGNMVINFFHSDSILYCSGNYKNSLDTLSHYVYDIDPLTGCAIPSVYKYFKPIKDDLWFYFNKKGKIISKLKYNCPPTTTPKW